MCTSSKSEVLVGFVSEKLSQVVGDGQINLFSTELPFLWERNYVLCCASLQLWLCTLCPGSKSEALVGFVAEKLSQVVGDLQVNFFGTELLFFMGKRFCVLLLQFVTLALYSVDP